MARGAGVYLIHGSVSSFRSGVTLRDTGQLSAAVVRPALRSVGDVRGEGSKSWGDGDLTAGTWGLLEEACCGPCLTFGDQLDRVFT